MTNDFFADFHPFVSLSYFVAVIGFSMFLMHPAFLAISLICAATYAIYLNGKKAVYVGIIFLLPMLIFTILLNPLFNHQGGTILAYLPNGNPVTLESIAFGISSAVMLITVITWFLCFNSVMTSDKFIYLFGKISPALSLILSMSLGFVPRFRAQVTVISNAQKGLNKTSGSSIKNAIKIVSMLVTWSLERAIETADSMKARGYGLPGRTAFSIFKFTKRDAWALTYIAICITIMIAGSITEVYRFRFFPTIRGSWYGFWTIGAFIVYFALAIMPVALNLKEDLTWIIKLNIKLNTKLNTK